MNRILVGFIVFLISLPVFPGKLVLTKRGGYKPPPKVKTLELFKRIPEVRDGVAPLKKFEGLVEERRVMALRVEFAEDEDERTTGNGKIDYEGNGEEPISDIIDGDTLLNPYYDGPHTKKYFEMLLECLKNFYMVNSYGNLRIQYNVFPDEDSAAYQLPHTMLYYGNPDNMELGLCALLRDAIIAAKEQDATLDFRQWLATSTDLIIFHAGSAWQTDIMWDSPYDIASVFIPRGALLYYLNDDSFLPFGLDGSIILPEMARQDGVMLGLEGEVCHEYAHSLGAFDLYDVTGRSMGIGAWDIMGYGGWLGDPVLPPGRVPSMHSAFFKYWKEWANPVVVENDTIITVDAAELDTSELEEATEKNLMVKIPINENEYYLIENRQEFPYSDTLFADMEMGVIIYVDGGQWDYFLPGSGLLIWHIDQGVIEENWAYNTVNAEASRKGVDLEEADGIQDFDGWIEGSNYEVYGSEYDAFFFPHNDSFGPRTNPNTADNDGGFTGIYVIDIGKSGNSMSLKVIKGGEEKFKPRKGFPVSLRDTSSFGTNSINLWERDGDYKIVVAGRSGNVSILENTNVTTLSTDDSICSSPLVCGDSVMFVTVNGEFYVWTQDTIDSLTLGNGPFYSSPAAGDIDGDDTLEVVVGSDDMYLYYIDNGEVVNRIFLGDVIRTSPGIVDLDGDGSDEVIASGGDSRLFVFDGNGEIVQGFPVIPEILGPLETSPVIGDLDTDGELELIGLSMEHKVYCFDASGNPEEYWPSAIGEPGFASPALGDIDQDGYLEVVLLTGGKLYAINHNGTICTGFPVELEEPSPPPSYWFEEDEEIQAKSAEPSSPVLVDFESDGYLEILFGYGTNVYGYDYRGKELDGFPLGCGGEVSSTPVALVRGDTLFLFAASDEGMLYCWELTENPTTVWPMFRADPTHSGSCLIPLSVPPVASTVLLKDVYNYPNPVYGSSTTLRYYLAEDATVKIKVFDVAGEIVGEYEGHVTPNEYNELVLDLSELASGLYVYKVEAKNSTRSDIVIGKLAIVR